MKKSIRLLGILFILCMLCSGISISASAESKQEKEWKTTANGQMYLVDGVPVKGLYEISGKTYVFSSGGILRKSKWTLCGEKKYYSNSTGVLVRNKLIRTKGKSYYVQEDGTALKKAWKTLPNGCKCYFGADGVRYTGIRKIGNKTYGLSATTGYLLKNKWILKDSKYYRTDKYGVLLKNKLAEINGKYYYFDENGVRLTKKWKTFTSGKSYFTSKGYRATGVLKIGKKTYYFNSKGYLVTGKYIVTASNATYYLDGNGVVEMKKLKMSSAELYYNTAGTQLNVYEVRNQLTLQKAREIVAKVTKASMTKEEKLFACFQWTCQVPYITRREFVNEPGWPALFANDILVLNGGNCHSYASAFGYLAKALGYQNIFVCTNEYGFIGEGHSWCEINGRIYDPLFAYEHSEDFECYYNGSYDTYYGLEPELHIAI